MILFANLLAVFAFVQVRQPAIPGWVWGLALAALLIFGAWRWLRGNKGRGETRVHRAEANERQDRARVAMSHLSEEQHRPAGKPKPVDAEPPESDTRL